MIVIGCILSAFCVTIVIFGYWLVFPPTVLTSFSEGGGVSGMFSRGGDSVMLSFYRKLHGNGFAQVRLIGVRLQQLRVGFCDNCV